MNNIRCFINFLWSCWSCVHCECNHFCVIENPIKIAEFVKPMYLCIMNINNNRKVETRCYEKKVVTSVKNQLILLHYFFEVWIKFIPFTCIAKVEFKDKIASQSWSCILMIESKVWGLKKFAGSSMTLNKYSFKDLNRSLIDKAAKTNW